MKTKYFVIYIILGFSIIVSVVTAADIQYPVEELGGCANEADCRSYCDSPDNTNACLDFAEKNNLMSDEEIAQARKFLAVGGKGPGGCEGKDACETYCNDISHIDECISFAEENDLIPPEELEEAKKVQAAIRRGVNPPACGNKKACDVYCEAPENMEECIAFGIEAGFIQGKEAEDAQKMLQAVKRGVKPPPCKGREACDEYCSSPDNMEVCMNFAIEAGFMSEEEAEGAGKMLQALKKGIKPPPCKGKEECDVYCGQEEHFEECMNFAVAAGFMSEEDAAMARKTGGKGPGDCKGKEECEAFCNNPDNQETCFNFAKEHGLIPEEDLQRMGSPAGQPGPGGCKTPEECQNYCQNNPEECQKFQPGPGEVNPGGQMMPQQAAPGGCKTPEESKAYCESNPQDCQNFQQGPSSGQPCEGENCQYGPPPQDGQIPPTDQQIQQEFQRQYEQEYQEQFQQQFQQQTAPSEPPPPPPPPSSLLNPESFLGSVLYIIAKALYSVR